MNARRAPLGELCEMDRRGIPPDDPLAVELPFIGVENVVSGTGLLNFDTDSRVGAQKSTAFRFDPRHVLYGKLRPYLNKVAVPDFAGRCSTELVPLLPRDGVDRDFLAHLLRRKETVEFVMASVTGARMPRTDMKVLMSMPVPLPPLDEQRRIADILNRSARIEQLRARAADCLHEFIPALFIRMFGDPVENPMGWNVISLGDVMRISSGQCLSAKNMLPGNYPVYGGNGISGYHSEFMFEHPKIVIGRVGAHCGVVHVSQPNSWITDNALFVREIRNTVNMIYLEWALRIANLNQYAGRAAQPLISGSRIYPVKILLPDESIQLKFCQIADTARVVASVAESAAKITSLLNASLMARLLDDAV